VSDRRPRVHDLGRLEVTAGEHLEPIRGRRPAAILRYLAIHADEVVPVDSVVDAVWGENASEGAWSTLDSHVFRLRKQLEPDRATGAPPAVLLKQGDGLRLHVSAVARKAHCTAGPLSCGAIAPCSVAAASVLIRSTMTAAGSLVVTRPAD
jgi:hypothetical protein